MKIRRTVLGGIGVALALALPAEVYAQSPKEFYSKNDVTLYIGYPPGAAYDIYGRLLGRHIGRNIPGQPRVLAKAMPGASTLVLTNYLYNVAPKDGSVFGGIHERIALEPMIDPKNARFDGRKLTWIGSSLKTTDVCMVWHTAPAKTIEEARKTPVIVGGTHSAGSGALVPRLLNAMVSTKFKLITGYQGADNFLAMERGETEGRCGMSWSGLKASRPDWLRDRKVILVVQMGKEKHAELQDVPLIMDLVKDEKDRRTLNFLFGTQEMGRPYAAPPNIPQDRREALRRAFDATMKDPALLKEAKAAGIEISPTSGERMEEIVSELYETPSGIVEYVESFRKPKAGEKNIPKKKKK